MTNTVIEEYFGPPTYHRAEQLINKYVTNGCSGSSETLVSAACAIRNGYWVEKAQMYFSVAVTKAKLDTLTAVRTHIVDELAALAEADIDAELKSQAQDRLNALLVLVDAAIPTANNDPDVVDV